MNSDYNLPAFDKVNWLHPFHFPLIFIYCILQSVILIISDVKRRFWIALTWSFRVLYYLISDIDINPLITRGRCYVTNTSDIRVSIIIPRENSYFYRQATCFDHNHKIVPPDYYYMKPFPVSHDNAHSLCLSQTGNTEISAVAPNSDFNLIVFEYRPVSKFITGFDALEFDFVSNANVSVLPLIFTGDTVLSLIQDVVVLTYKPSIVRYFSRSARVVRPVTGRSSFFYFLSRPMLGLNSPQSDF